ncbi:MAG: hypothetical protein KAW51_05555, partial [Candidatus Lokiarchaeota archaeon]|nr:hypothetical protein [Candidatus Lokiarchaeota archaeon]
MFLTFSSISFFLENLIILDFNEIENQNEIDPKISSIYNKNIIVFFRKPSYNNTVTSQFENYGGTIKREWNNQFSSFSGFAGIMPLEMNKIAFQNEFRDAKIENDEILEAQMNYASIQSGAINSTWYLNGLKGDTDSSIAVLDTGVNSNHDFLIGDIIGWENFVDTQPISDDNGHGTLITSIISGTGIDPYDSITPSIVKIHGNYSHRELFGGGSALQNFTLKLFSFNASKVDSSILINSSWTRKADGILNFWFELHYNNTLVNYSYNENPNDYYI